MDQELELVKEEMDDEFISLSTQRFHDDMDTLTLDYIMEALTDYVMGGTETPAFIKYARFLSPARLLKLRASLELLLNGTD